MRIFWALFKARNKEFTRDRATLSWNFIFPFLVIFGFAMVFSGGGRDLYKVGVIGLNGTPPAEAALPFLHTKLVSFIAVQDPADAREQVRRHRLDMVIELSDPPRYWINETNPKGYFLERVLWGSGEHPPYEKVALAGKEIRYVDWLLPGVLGMNMMFSALFGVGYVIVRYRKGGILRRLKATPVTPLHFITAQVASRLMLVITVTIILFVGSDLVLDFYVVGSLLDLLLVFLLGGFCLISLSLAVASRTSSQELAGGLLNMATWPMMFLSGVWFSLEGSPDWLIWFSRAFPLTHLTDAARAIMVDGATLGGVWPQLAAMLGMTAVFLAIGAALFRWE